MRIGEACRPGVVTIGEDEGIVEAAAKMRRYHVGCLVVVDGLVPPTPTGILTDRDIAIGLVGARVPNLEQLTVSDVLGSEALVTADEQEPLMDVYIRMRQAGVRRMPVVDEAGQLVGIFTLDDALQGIADQLSELVSIVQRQRTDELRNRP